MASTPPREAPRPPAEPERRFSLGSLGLSACGSRTSLAPSLPTTPWLQGGLGEALACRLGEAAPPGRGAPGSASAAAASATPGSLLSAVASVPALERLAGDAPGSVYHQMSFRHSLPGRSLQASESCLSGGGSERGRAERVHTESQQGRRQDQIFEVIARVEADLERIAKLAAENEGLHAAERHQKHLALANLTRRAEDALMTCESLRRGQEHLVQRVERVEAVAEDRDRAADDARLLQRDVVTLRGALQERQGGFSHALRRLDAMEQTLAENARLRHEVAQLRRANERRDLEMAAVQGQVDALTKLVRERLRESFSPQRERVSTSV